MKPFREPKTWRYELENGWITLAGKTDEDNDLLSLHFSRPNDTWFHVKGLPGSHVILQGDGSPDNSTLKIAASIAAWHSKARDAGMVAVQYTKAVNVSKPRGAKAGAVLIKKEKTIKVRPALPSDI